MTDSTLAAELAAVRAELAPALPHHVEPRSVEVAAFSAVGERDLALRVWGRLARRPRTLGERCGAVCASGT